MEHCRAAEQALVAALVMGDVHPAELSGRVHQQDFTDPAAGVVFAASLEDGRPGPITDLPRLLRSRGALRSDGYPIREVVAWLPVLPVPAHPQAWATLVVAGSLGRVVQACGIRLLQAVHPEVGGPEAGRVLAVAAAQRAALHGAVRRWHRLPASWLATVPPPSAPFPSPTAEVEPETESVRGLELEVLAGLLAAPRLLDRMPWLWEADFTDPAAAQVFGTLRTLHTDGRPVDLVTLTAATKPAAFVTPPWASPEGGGAAQLCRDLRPDRAVPTTVPFLARRMLQDAVIRQSRRAGEDLVTLAGVAGSTGGLDRPLLDAALQRLDVLRPYAERLEQALRPATAHAVERTRTSSRHLAAPREASVVHRHAG